MKRNLVFVLFVVWACDSKPSNRSDAQPDLRTTSDGAQVTSDLSQNADATPVTDLRVADATPPPADCAKPEIRCVNGQAGPTQEYATIQDAIDASAAGNTVLVFPGDYAGFNLSKGGSSQAPITVRAAGTVNLTSPCSVSNNIIRISDSSYVVIDGFTITQAGSPRPYSYDNACVAARGAPVTRPMRGLVVRNMDVSGCSPAGMYFSQAAGLVLERNRIHHNVHDQRGGNGQAVYLSNAATDDVIVRGNQLHDNAGPGIHFNGDINVGGDGVQTGHIIENNIFADNGQNGLNMDGVQSATLINNVIADSARHGVRGYKIDGAQGPKDFVVINNTFVRNGSTAIKFTADEGGHILFNNFLVANTTNSFAIDETTPQVSHNTTAATAAAEFQNTGTRNFKLSGTSSALGQGTSAFAGKSSPSTDLAGTARSAPPDVGAYEGAR